MVVQLRVLDSYCGPDLEMPRKYIDGLVQVCNISNDNTLARVQPCTKPSI